MKHPPKPSKSRSFVATNWNCNSDEWYRQLVAKGEVVFIAWGMEIAPTTNTPHHQTFMYFKNPKCLPRAARMIFLRLG